MTEIQEPKLTPFSAGELHLHYLGAPMTDQTKYKAICQLLELKKAVEMDHMIDLNRSACYLTLHSIIEQCDRAAAEQTLNPTT